MGIPHRSRGALVEHVHDAIADADKIDKLVDDLLAYISSNLDPNEVFSEEQLRSWAEHNGMIDDPNA